MPMVSVDQVPRSLMVQSSTGPDEGGLRRGREILVRGLAVRAANQNQSKRPTMATKWGGKRRLWPSQGTAVPT
jgi:hypothetical protein